MAWQQLHAIISATQVEQLEDELLNLGALSITLQDAEDTPIFEPELTEQPIWDKTRLSALFDMNCDVTKVAGKLQSLHPGQILNIKTELLPDQDWERAWLEHFKPMQFADNFWVVPTGYDIPDKNAVNLMLDPGLAFGTGTHPTTAMCLEWLAKHDIHNKHVIDYGCGSGILAIAALLLDAKAVWAIDYDPQALIATQDNAERNQVNTDKLLCGKNADLPKDYLADVMVANILANPLITLAPTLAKHVKTDGWIILSGILAEQTDEVIETYKNDFDMQAPMQQEDWVCIVGRKN